MWWMVALAYGGDIPGVAQRAIPAVVHLQVKKGRAWAPSLQEMAQDFGAHLPKGLGLREASGSGVFVDAEGTVLTNHHVVEGAFEITVVLADQRRFPAHLIGQDPRTDLAVLDVEGAGPFPWLPIAKSDSLIVGEPVVVVGNPFDFQSSVTTGIVSALGRRQGWGREVQDYIQTDAAVNPGNSGGPILDLNGEIVGIATAIFAPEADQSAGISFGIPASMIGRVFGDLKAGRQVQRPWFGLDAGRSGAVGAELSRRGPEILRVIPGSPAAIAQVRRGDVVVAVDGAATPTEGALWAALASRGIGQKTRLSLLRGEVPLEIEVRPDRVGQWEATIPVAPSGRWAGAGIAPATPALCARLGLPPTEGLVVATVDEGSLAARMGMMPGDKLIAVRGEPVSTPEHLLRWLNAHEGGLVPVKFGRGEERLVTWLPLPSAG